MLKEKIFKNRGASVYFIVEAPQLPDDDNLDQMLKVYTVVPHLKNVPEAIEALIKKDHEEHFKAWCSLRELDASDINNWDNYIEQVVGVDNLTTEVSRYSYLKIKLNSSEVAAMMRSFHNCDYLSCSFETAESQINKLADEAAEEAVKMINDSLQEKEK